MPKPQAERQPFRQKGVDLGLFIRMVHEFIWISVDRFDPLIATTADHLGNSGIVITAHGELGIVQPAPPVMDLLQQKGVGVLAVFDHLQGDRPQVYFTITESKLTAISQQAGTRQLTYPEVIRLSQCTQSTQVRNVLFSPSLGCRSAQTHLSSVGFPVRFILCFTPSRFYHRMVQRQPLKCHDGGSIVNLS